MGWLMGHNGFWLKHVIYVPFLSKSCRLFVRDMITKIILFFGLTFLLYFTRLSRGREDKAGIDAFISKWVEIAPEII